MRWIGRSGRWLLLLTVVTAPSVATVAAAAGQADTASGQASCTQENGTYRCDLAAFKEIFAKAQTVAIQTRPRDHIAHHELREFIKGMGKSVAAPGVPADLTFALNPVPSSGVSFGPEDHPLGTLLVYAPKAAVSDGTLVWAETFRGEGDRPWPSIAGALLQQFKERVGKD